MATVHFRKPMVLFGAVSVSFATLAVETSAQPLPAPEHPVSNAMAEALRSPFHRDHAPTGRFGDDLLSASSATPRELHGAAQSPPSHSQGPRVPASDGPPSNSKVFWLSTLAAALGYFGTVHLAEWCETRIPPGRYDALWGGGVLREPGDEDVSCAVESDEIRWMGFAATIPMTASGATLAGSDFWRSLAGSALGFASGWVAVLGVRQAGDWIRPTGRFEMSDGVTAGVLTLVHAATTTLVAK